MYYGFSRSAPASLTLISLLLLVVGFGSCFVGNRLRKTTQAVLGFLCGYIIAAFLYTLGSYDSFSSYNSDPSVGFLVFGAIFALLSGVYEKFFAFIHGFTFSFLALAALFGTSVDSPAFLLLLSLGLAIWAACYEDKAFTALVPFSGAFFGSLGLVLLLNADDIYSALSIVRIAFDDSVGLLLILTIGAGIGGLFVQRSYLQQNDYSDSSSNTPPSLKTCPRCGTTQDRNATTCWKCKHRFDSEPEGGSKKVCPQCGTMLSNDRVTCWQCGHQLNGSESSPPSVPSSPETPTSNTPEVTKTPAPEAPAPESQVPSRKAKIIGGMKVCPQCRTSQSPDGTSCWFCGLVFDD